MSNRILVALCSIVCCALGCSDPDGPSGPTTGGPPSGDFLPLTLGNVWCFEGVAEMEGGVRSAIAGIDSVSSSEILEGTEMWRVDGKWGGFADHSFWIGQRGDTTFLFVDEVLSPSEPTAWPAFLKGDSPGTERLISRVDSLIPEGGGARILAEQRVRVGEPECIDSTLGVFDGVRPYTYVYDYVFYGPSFPVREARRALTLFLVDGYGPVGHRYFESWSFRSGLGREGGSVFVDGVLTDLSVR